MQIVTHFHGEQIELRETASSIESEVLQRKHLQEVRLHPTELCWVICQPTFDLITQILMDACHILLQGITPLFQEILLNHTLKDSARPSFGEAFQQLSVALLWTALQNPVSHWGSLTTPGMKVMQSICYQGSYPRSKYLVLCFTKSCIRILNRNERA